MKNFQIVAAGLMIFGFIDLVSIAITQMLF